MNAHLHRAEMLIGQSRFDSAEQELGQALADDPNNSHALVLMALCLLERKQFDRATEHAERAVAQSPDDPFSHYALAFVWLRRRFFDRAEEAAEESIRLDPYHPLYHVTLGRVRLAQKRYSDAVVAADEALALDPDDTNALNLRAQSLRQSGQNESAIDNLQDALQLNPGDSDTHANLGWNYLEQGNRSKAKEHFREALRLDPESEWARLGIIETIKSGNLVYRLILNWFLWMQKKVASAQWAIMVGAFVAFLVCLNLVRSNPSLGIVLWPLLFAYIAFCVATWFATPLSNLALRLHPFGRLALSQQESRDATIVGGALLVTGAIYGIYLYVDTLTSWVFFRAALNIAVATSMITLLRQPKARRVMLYYAMAAAFVSIIAALTLPLAKLSGPNPGALMGLWNLVAAICIPFFPYTILGTVILANICSTRNWTDADE